MSEEKSLGLGIIAGIVAAGLIIIVVISFIGLPSNDIKTEYIPSEQIVPTLPEDVPADANWSGGCEGGEWIYLVNDSSNYYHFRVYRDYDGALKMDALFTTADSCNLTKQNWKNVELYYSESCPNDTSVCISYKQGDKWITLHSVYPAYGGETWETIKEKYSLP